MGLAGLLTRTQQVGASRAAPHKLGPVPATLIVNPWASGVTPELVAAVERELAADGPLETLLTTRAGHATELAAEASEGSERIYVFSGDGGFN